jgi:hypothetical protein
MNCMFCNEQSDLGRIFTTTIPHCPSCRFQWTYSFLERNCPRYLFLRYLRYIKRLRYQTNCTPTSSEVRILPALRLFTSTHVPKLCSFDYPYFDPYPYEILDDAHHLMYFYRTNYRVHLLCNHEHVTTYRDHHTRMILLSYLNNTNGVIERHSTVSNDTMRLLPFDLIRLRCIRDMTHQLLHSILQYYPPIHSRKRLSAMDLIRSRCYYTHGYWGGTLQRKQNTKL